ncbi:MAG: DM13 domain-containing protein [Pseudomonadota bacterium]
MSTSLTSDHIAKNAMRLLGITIFSLFLLMGNSLAGEPASWENQETKVKGEWQIEKRSDGNYLLLGDEFKTRNAPDLKLFLSKKNFSDVKGSNATQDAIFLAKLNSNKGAQAYKIPANVNLQDYESLVLHCEQFSKLWASTPIH